MCDPVAEELIIIIKALHDAGADLIAFVEHTGFVVGQSGLPTQHILYIVTPQHNPAIVIHPLPSHQLIQIATELLPNFGDALKLLSIKQIDPANGQV